MSNTHENIIAAAIENLQNNAAAKALTLDAAWRQHGPSSQRGSYVMGTKSQEEFEETLKRLDWSQAAEFPGGRVMEARLPRGLAGFLAACAASELSPDAAVKIDLSETGHPAAVVVGADDKVTDIITCIIEDQAENDPDINSTGITGSIVATWFPGHSTPRSNHDGQLKHGDIVSVKEAMEHGFMTVKFER